MLRRSSRAARALSRRPFSRTRQGVEGRQQAGGELRVTGVEIHDLLRHESVARAVGPG